MSTKEKEYVNIKPMTSEYDSKNAGTVIINDYTFPIDTNDYYHDVAMNITRFEGMGQIELRTVGEIIKRVSDVLAKLKLQIEMESKIGEDVHGTAVDGTYYDKIKTNIHTVGIEYINYVMVDGVFYAAIVMSKLEWFNKPSLYWKRQGPNREMVVIPLTDVSPREISKYFTISKSEEMEEMQIKLGNALKQKMHQMVQVGAEYPVAAAIYHTGVVFEMQRPYRHHHILQTKEYSAWNSSMEENKVVVQGFVTNFGNFVTRRRALILSADKGMIISDLTMHLARADAAQYIRHDVEKTMTGRPINDDRHFPTYAVTETGLFSEDLW